jgi:cytochrome P450
MSSQVLLGIGPDEPDTQLLARAFGNFVAATGVSPGGRRYLARRYWVGMLARRRLGLLFRRRAESAHGRDSSCALKALVGGFTGASTSAGPLTDHLLALLIAARETTASLITWCLIELAGDPHHARLAAAEARAALAQPYLLVQPDALPMLRAVIAEVQRLHSPNLLSIRRAIVPLSLCGYDIPAGVRVAYCTSAGHFDEADFPNPNVFQPDRFLSGQASSARLWAFGGGAHACLGRPLAELMTISALTSVLNRGLPRLLDAAPVGVRYRPAKAPLVPVPFALDRQESL